jgi:hypothetical protein
MQSNSSPRPGKEGERDTKSTAGVREVPVPETLRVILA